jgi:diguanylate cyclase (GGDEF)-like protein/PAS domain S-box-containing protein
MDRIAPDVIVAVDDDEGLHKMMGYLLRVPNTTLVPARSGGEALSILRGGLPDLLLLDAMLPDATGFDLCRRLRSEHPPERLPILMITALQDPDSVNAAFDAGADDYITKPINWAVLRRRVTRLLAAKRSHSELATTERVMERLIEHAPDALLSLDPAGTILTANRAARSLLLAPGSREPLVGRRLAVLLRSGDGDPGTIEEGEATVEREDGSSLALEVSVGKVSVDRSTRWVVILRDVTGRKRGEDELRHRALYDPLTDLPNRTFFLERLEKELSPEGEERQLGVIFIDLDDFKKVNDECGHQAGDAYLAEIARRLRKVLRSDDTVCRYGGDEFCAILKGISSEAVALAVVERIRAALGQPLTLDGRIYHPRASIGLAPAVRASTPRELVARADAAMYQAKRSGKGSYRLWHEAPA